MVIRLCAPGISSTDYLVLLNLVTNAGWFSVITKPVLG